METKYAFFNYLAIFNNTTREIFPPIKPVELKLCYFWASDKEMWEIINIPTVITDRAIFYFNVYY